MNNLIDQGAKDSVEFDGHSDVVKSPNKHEESCRNDCDEYVEVTFEIRIFH